MGNQLRKQKKREKANRLAELRRRRWDRCTEILGPFGLAEGFLALDDHTEEQLWQECYLPPTVVIDLSMDQEQEELKAAVQDLFAEAKVTLANATLPLAPACTILIPLLRAFGRTVVDPDHPPVQYFRDARAISDSRCEETTDRVFNQLDKELLDIAIRYSSINERLMWCSAEFDGSKGGKKSLGVTLGKARPQRIDVTIDGKTRPAYRCGG